MQNTSDVNLIKSKAVFGLNFSMLTLEEVVKTATCNEIGHHFPSRLLITPNVDHIVTLHNNPTYREACHSAWLLTVDGFPVERFLSLVGVKIPERVTGADLFPKLMQAMRPDKHRPCFMVATEFTQHFLTLWLKKHGFNESEFLVEVPPFGFEKNDDFSKSFIEKLKSVQCTHLYMGVGAPKSEIWAYLHRDSIENMHVFCFGAAIEFFSENMTRAPVWMQKNGFEWLWRLGCEPSRLAKRYLINSWKFFYYAGKEMLNQRKLGYENK
ncbi:WecB/TagA/CpsF family glycosyltransferase [Iodobacter fluviatilis]|uniref:N-acetylglucosaminyldiphosphoundecaprenol N-acetyl-beta-D-mannosaminyltransferase n=1 Tax=Iodobacter fluviatilis TaxID=537 RepID=A0A377Q532_9NEIS|nr:WecB/TagA/CpsF family glycosyltransferase [Iodobacter fluviatilis]TCU81508.1 N-acetylglucosaminyldiphosphoundecaprenol N-acetyl-beta-D-mannosaminyltransferase [Iodobacter fluviatilis]STQ89922.1 Putative N-acetylmannosaminyltransferase [Iodobacter fluviatilis]